MRDESDEHRIDPERILPRLSPLGILELGENDAASARVYPRSLRLVALVIVSIFLIVVVVTTSLSLGAVCLTTDADRTPPPRRGVESSRSR